MQSNTRLRTACLALLAAAAAAGQQVRYAGYGAFDRRFGHLFHEGEFASYKLRVEYRFVGRQCPRGGRDGRSRTAAS